MRLTPLDSGKDGSRIRPWFGYLRNRAVQHQLE